MTTRIIVQNAGPSDVDLFAMKPGEKKGDPWVEERTHSLKPGDKATTIYVHDAMHLRVREVPHPVTGPSTEAPPAPAVATAAAPTPDAAKS